MNENEKEIAIIIFSVNVYGSVPAGIHIEAVEDIIRPERDIFRLGKRWTRIHSSPN
ncbi:hypothetical protein HZF24_11875 [Sedimentibacter hydroxybenzoicus DSM 7310]|uniref:Uncharacterized protein n=1 Tax=Sedimentibacter hydroxybenzoicus DSM 7310 TaxID=1123245 RepID=A0A974BL33_SEDHY|nr:hypothetical protein [Sedimentibacter hydroxybenzoicus]NYB74836.1 hypothetical protein [Sedimentibacter hydroxybenzoicus DSM 7310]